MSIRVTGDLPSDNGYYRTIKNPYDPDQEIAAVKGIIIIISMAKPKVVRHQRTRAKSGIKVIQIGTSTGAIFPKEMLAQLKVQKGDTLFTVETPDGILLTPYDPAVEKQLEAGREFMREYRDTFRALAK